MCRDYEMSGIDVVSGCFTAVNDTFGAMANDPTFLQQCMAVVDCAYQNGCGGAPRGLSACYCGSADETSCIMNGPAEDAKCVPQIKAASRTELNTDISMRFSDFAYPLGWALNLLDCDHKYCAATCGP
jgi:hypothetical protein